MNCTKCGRFVGRDGYLEVYYDLSTQGYESGNPLCGPCGRKEGREDKREVEKENKK